MVICEECNSESSVKDSRPMHKTVRRRRVCDNCGHKWTTFEVSRGLMLCLRNLPGLVQTLNTGAQDLVKFHDDIAKMEEMLIGGQGPTKQKRQLQPRMPMQ